MVVKFQMIVLDKNQCYLFTLWSKHLIWWIVHPSINLKKALFSFWLKMIKSTLSSKARIFSDLHEKRVSVLSSTVKKFLMLIYPYLPLHMKRTLENIYRKVFFLKIVVEGSINIWKETWLSINKPLKKTRTIQRFF